MKSFVASLVALAVIGVGAWSVLNREFQKSAEQKFTTEAVRLSAETH